MKNNNNNKNKRAIDGDHEEKEDRVLSKRLRLSLEACSSTSASSASVLPRDLIITEILTRVSLEQLICQCRLVCKDWRHLTYQSDFKLAHSQRTPTISGYLLWMVSQRGKTTKFVSFANEAAADQSSPPMPSPLPVDLDFLPLTPEEKLTGIVSSSSPHGIFLCSVYTGLGIHRCFYVCKPATREWRKIPDPSNTIDFDTLYFSIVVHKQQQQKNSPIHYKIIRLGFTTRTCSDDEMIDAKYYSYGTCYYLDCEIFDSNTWEWKKLRINDGDDVGNDSPRDKLLIPSCFHSTISPIDEPPVLVHGAIHWLSFYDHEICVLNINDGSWKIIAPPRDEQLRNEMHEYVSREDASYRYAHQMRLVECEGELGLLYLGFRKRLTLELWVLKDYNYQSDETIIWNKIFLIDLGPGYGEIWLSHLKCRVLQLYSKDIILMQIEDEVVWYNRKTGIRSVAFKIPSGYSIQNMHPIHSDLLPCKI